MEKIVGLKDLRENLNKYASEVKRGKNLIIVRRSKPLFKIVPLEEEWETVIDFTEINPRGVDARDVIAALEKLDEQDRKSTQKIKAHA